MEPGGPSIAALLADARAEARAGRAESAWALGRQAAEAARAAGDARALADAAVVVVDVDHAPLAGEIHRLCREALAVLGEDDPARGAAVRAQLEATRSPWRRDSTDLVTGPDPDPDPDARFLALSARHAELAHVEHAEERLDLGDEAVALGEACGRVDLEVAGLGWRLTALAQTGRRLEADADAAALAAIVARSGHPPWVELLHRVRASSLMLDGRFDAAREEVARTSGYLTLVLESALASWTGEGLAEVETRVRAALDDAPYLARGWHAQVLAALGRRDEAEALWRGIAPHVREVPRRAPEWLIATVGHAELCVVLDDVTNAPAVLDELVPHAHRQVVGRADTPHHGPVSLALGRLARLLGRRDEAESWAADALHRAESIHARPAVARAHLELARVVTSPSAALAHEERARRLADELGMAPLAAEVASVADTRASGRRGPLSARETEIAALLAEGLANRAIAGRLHLSERTVENHVSHIMRKIERPTRAGVVAWFLRPGP